MQFTKKAKKSNFLEQNTFFRIFREIRSQASKHQNIAFNPFQTCLDTLYRVKLVIIINLIIFSHVFGCTRLFVKNFRGRKSWGNPEQKNREQKNQFPYSVSVVLSTVGYYDDDSLLPFNCKCLALMAQLFVFPPKADRGSICFALLESHSFVYINLGKKVLQQRTKSEMPHWASRSW